MTRSTVLPHARYLDVIRSETARFAQVLATTPEDARVPTCPDWSAADLRWHLAQVQHVWAEVVAARPSTQDPPEDPDRPAGRADVDRFGDRSAVRLVDELAAADPADPCWTWAVGGGTCGWAARRQAHEALVHRLDAELTAGARTPFDPALALDGVDEVLRYFWSWRPAWASVTETGPGRVRFAVPDAGASWVVAFATWSGTSPQTGKTWTDEKTLLLVDDDGGEVAATVSGTAEDLDCHLWHRPTPGSIARDGDPDVLAALDALLAEDLD